MRHMMPCHARHVNHAAKIEHSARIAAAMPAPSAAWYRRRDQRAVVASSGRRYVTNCGFAAAAIDAPGHGGRPKTEQDERFVAEVRPRMLAGEPVWPQIAEHNADLAERGVPEWRVTLDALLAEAGLAGGGPG